MGELRRWERFPGPSACDACDGDIDEGDAVVLDLDEMLLHERCHAAREAEQSPEHPEGEE